MNAFERPQGGFLRLSSETDGDGQAAPGINWNEIYTRLEEARQALEGERFGPEEARRILTKRAQTLAQAPQDLQTPIEEVELLVFSLAKERYGVDPSHILDVAPVQRLTPIPGTPAFVLGVMNYRGQLRPVLDLRRVLDPGGPGSAGKSVVAVEVNGMMFGILCDAVVGMIRVGTEEILSAPAALGTGQRAYVRGVTRDMVTVLDLEALTRDPRIVVNDEVG